MLEDPWLKFGVFHDHPGIGIQLLFIRSLVRVRIFGKEEEIVEVAVGVDGCLLIDKMDRAFDFFSFAAGTVRILSLIHI